MEDCAFGRYYFSKVPQLNSVFIIIIIIIIIAF